MAITPAALHAPQLLSTGSLFNSDVTGEKDGWQHWLVGLPLTIAIIVLCCVVTWLVTTHLIKRVTNRLVSKATTSRESVARRSQNTTDLQQVLLTQRRRQRAEAISSLLRSVTTAIIAAVGILLILAQLNINITPLLASAGVVGVALGFGAQSLVKDYLSGIFLVLEDQYGIGDVVDFGPVVGVVEDTTLRITRVRDMSGVVWYLRNGEIIRVANRSQGWTMAVVDIPIAYNEDLEKVRNLVNAVADDLDADTSYDEMLLGRMQFAGVESVTNEYVTIRVTAKAAPEQQNSVTRLIRERLKLTFDRAGIRVPAMPPQPDDSPASGPQTSSPPAPGDGQPRTYGSGPLKP